MSAVLLELYLHVLVQREFDLAMYGLLDKGILVLAGMPTRLEE